MFPAHSLTLDFKRDGHVGGEKKAVGNSWLTFLWKEKWEHDKKTNNVQTCRPLTPIGSFMRGLRKLLKLNLWAFSAPQKGVILTVENWSAPLLVYLYIFKNMSCTRPCKIPLELFPILWNLSQILLVFGCECSGWRALLVFLNTDFLLLAKSLISVSSDQTVFLHVCCVYYMAFGKHP